MKILQLTVHYAPNLGGVETHLTDLVNALVKRKHNVFVLTYRPLVAKVPFQRFEQTESFCILRIPWIPGLFYKLKGLFQFLYTAPGLFLVTPFIILFYNPDVVHVHGIVAGFVGVFWGKAFGKRVLISTHSLYEFPEFGAYRSFVKGIFYRADKVLTLSNQSAKEIESLGISKNKIQVFTYWVDLEKFTIHSPSFIEKTKNRLGWRNKFVVLFVGRLVPEKGISELLEASKELEKNIVIAIAGAGPLESLITDHSSQFTNLQFLGKVEQDKLPDYYNAADVVIVPSTHEEGFGRVIIESLACGKPVIGSNRGAIPEAMDNTVGQLIDVKPENIAHAINTLSENTNKLSKLSKNARKFAENHYSEKNIIDIIHSYKGV
jgi:glycosyltransferase involved in cell wall biosynthesis